MPNDCYHTIGEVYKTMKRQYRVYFWQAGKQRLQQIEVTTGHSWVRTPTFEEMAQIIELKAPMIEVIEVTTIAKIHD